MISSKRGIVAVVGRSLLAVAVFMATAATAIAQNQNDRVAFPSRSLTVREVLNHIQSQTDFVFAVNLGRTDVGRRVVLSSTAMTVRRALDETLGRQGVNYIVDGRQVVVLEQNSPNAPTTSAPPARQPRQPEQNAWQARETPRPAPPQTPPASLQPEWSAPSDTPHEGRYTYKGRSFGPSYTGRRVGTYPSSMPRMAVKANLLYGVAAAAPNLSFELATGPRTSVELTAGLNGWNRKGTSESNKKLAHAVIKPEFRYWTCERFNGHYFGVHAFMWRFNVGEHDIPLLFEKEYRYDGRAWGGGVSWGYHWAVSDAFGVEFNLGLGAAVMNYDRYNCVRCSSQFDKMTKTYFGPTAAGVKLLVRIR
jgi:DNA-directed RNA polymerase subunit RPC12/RpoP